jgi:hypothetical protein
MRKERGSRGCERRRRRGVASSILGRVDDVDAARKRGLLEGVGRQGISGRSLRKQAKTEVADQLDVTK